MWFELIFSKTLTLVTNMKIHYLEIVTFDIDGICRTYDTAHNVSFTQADDSLGGARTCTLPDGSIVGVRGTLSDSEAPVIRPYWLVGDIEAAVKEVENQGAKILHPPLEISGKGTFAIYSVGSIQQGFWQL